MAMRTLLLLGAVSLLCSHFCAALEDDAKKASTLNEDHREHRHHEGKVEDHDPTVDQEILAGSSKEKRRLDALPPEEAKKEIRKLVVKIDVDKDGHLDRTELIQWIVKVDKSYFTKELDEQWPMTDIDKDGFITFKEYVDSYRGNIDDTESYLDEDRAKFQMADQDKDGKLNKTEFSAFLFPDQHKHMLDHLVVEYLGKYDTNQDGHITFDEYMTVFANLADEEDVPEWVESEKREFHDVLDTNKDGRLDPEELRGTVGSDGELFAAEEADHLLEHADIDEDGKLSVEEVEEAFEIFLDSQVTDFGSNIHDEL